MVKPLSISQEYNYLKKEEGNIIYLQDNLQYRLTEVKYKILDGICDSERVHMVFFDMETGFEEYIDMYKYINNSKVSYSFYSDRGLLLAHSVEDFSYLIKNYLYGKHIENTKGEKSLASILFKKGNTKELIDWKGLLTIKKEGV